MLSSVLFFGFVSLAQTEDFKFKPEEHVVKLESGIQYVEVKKGEGMPSENGQTLVMHYTLWLDDGKKIDSSRGENRGVFRFTLGKGEVIEGWEQGVKGMKVGGVRKLMIPPELGYGARGVGDQVPPNATLWFDVELLEITEPTRFRENEKPIKTGSGLEYADLKIGEGEAAKEGDLVYVTYLLYNERKDLLDTNLFPGRKPFQIELGKSKVIKGFDEAIRGMKPGGKRKVRIPPELAYGDKGSGPVRPGDVLWFTIELVDIQKP
jgi:peptidylprolyl isomerase